jgi:fermentation-respiration switch protein FrsA (DUF1100 family)
MAGLKPAVPVAVAAALRSLARIALLLLAAWFAAASWMWWTQDSLVYHPRTYTQPPATPARLGLAFEDVRLRTADGETLAGWWVPARGATRAALVFNGNAGNITHRLDYLQPLQRMGYSVLLFDYRGYGASSGRPGEQGTYRDADAAWAWLMARGYAPRQVLLLGESLGGAVAAELAARVQPGALILASTFTSLNDLGSELYPWLPVRRISRYGYDTLAAVRAYRGPLLVAHSPGDRLVPYAHGERLHAAAPGPRELLALAGDHNDAFVFARPQWTAAVAAFLAREAAPENESK